MVNDWMNEIYERFAAAHAVIFVTPVYWYQVSSSLKVLMDRLVCADGGHPDPTTTHGKNAEEAKTLELAGWDYPKHLAGRAYGLVVHGDVAGIEGSRHALIDWLDWIGFVEAGGKSRLDRLSVIKSPTRQVTPHWMKTLTCKKKSSMSRLQS